jgi:hypothetical protein
MGMKRIGWLFLVLALSLALTHCSQPEQVGPTALDALARWVPSNAETPMFLDLRPGGEAGRHWERIRRQLEANPTAQQGLDAVFHEFRVEEFGLDELIVGPAVMVNDGRTGYVIAQVSDGEAAKDALLQHFKDLKWEQEEHEIQLRALVSLAEADSLAALSAWRTLRGRLPETSMGLFFVNFAEQRRRYPPAPNDTSLGTALSQQLVAMAFAAVPEQEGMRVEIAGIAVLQTDVPPKVRALFNLPAVDPAAWPGLPASPHSQCGRTGPVAAASDAGWPGSGPARGPAAGDPGIVRDHACLVRL